MNATPPAASGLGAEAELTRQRGADLLQALSGKLPLALERSEVAARIGTELPATVAAEDEVELIAETARLGEIGKLYLPSELLRKPPGELSPAERAELAGHPEQGRALALGAGVAERPSAWILHSRERWDGGGPNGLSGAEIPLASRIIAVAREYLDAPLLAGAGGQSDPLAASIARLRTLSGSVLDPELASAAIRLADPSA